MLTHPIAHRIELCPIDRLNPSAGNPRTHSEEQVAQIAASIVELGFNNPILVDSKNGIIAGHGRSPRLRSSGSPRFPSSFSII